MRTALTITSAVVVASLFTYSAFNAPRVREIPLRAVFAHLPQRNVQQIFASVRADRVKPTYVAPYSHDLQRILNKFDGVDNDVFLVRGDDLTQAIKATSLRVNDRYGAGIAVDPDFGKTPKDLWLVFRLGTSGSMPPAWQLGAIRIDGREITVSYSEPVRFSQTCDIYTYIGWAPLGQLPPGEYTLKLVNTSKVRTECQRHVVVEGMR